MKKIIPGMEPGVICVRPLRLEQRHEIAVPFQEVDEQ